MLSCLWPYISLLCTVFVRIAACGTSFLFTQALIRPVLLLHHLDLPSLPVLLPSGKRDYSAPPTQRAPASGWRSPLDTTASMIYIRALKSATSRARAPTPASSSLVAHLSRTRLWNCQSDLVRWLLGRVHDTNPHVPSTRMRAYPAGWLGAYARVSAHGGRARERRRVSMRRVSAALPYVACWLVGSFLPH
ncbi:hypothetical protein B0H10DRAFT_931874 [Mycena sp. CBHHK59/15]|nr:hypothetical protein B0H10DRAFT_931874 [Mycena sp. CBHHK59/15]